ncbi:MAG: hypothetical protein R3E39_29335 [Anaerolineae bacterium]
MAAAKKKTAAMAAVVLLKRTQAELGRIRLKPQANHRTILHKQVEFQFPFSIAENEADKVTIWPNIWSPFSGCGTNHFEGADVLRRLVDGRTMV